MTRCHSGLPETRFVNERDRDIHELIHELRNGWARAPTSANGLKLTSSVVHEPTNQPATKQGVVGRPDLFAPAAWAPVVALGRCSLSLGRSVGLSVGLSVCRSAGSPSVGLSVGLSVSVFGLSRRYSPCEIDDLSCKYAQITLAR